jgi:hypothetical protein
LPCKKCRAIFYTKKPKTTTKVIKNARFLPWFAFSDKKRFTKILKNSQKERCL